MEVERLTATLEASGLAGFTAAMAAADKATGSVSSELKSLAAIAKIADAALAGVKVSSAQAAETTSALSAMQRSVSGVTATALAAADALDQVKVGPGQAAATAASTGEIVASLQAVESAAADARRSLEGLTAVRLAAGGAGAGGKGGLLGAAGWGGGWFGMAGIGSVLGLAGFGAEHLITSVIGVLGSIGGGLLGGGLLGLGAAGTSAVGMGTDMAGIGQAAGDIKQVNTALGNLDTAIQTYGRNSQQAAQAQAQLNTTLGSFSPVARNAVLAAAQTSQQFSSMFDKATGQAEKTGAEIINQAMHIGESFLPTIGRYAAQNMGIIQAQLQPLFAWLQNPGFSRPGFGGGLGIFTNLEQVFQRNLPAAVQAGSQALEFFVRTVDVAAQQTGHLMQTIDRFFTHMNQAGPFSRWAVEVDKLIGLFRSWMGLAGALVGTLFALFKPAVGFGQAFAQTLTQVVDQVKNWLNLASTQQTLHGLFDVHLVEVIQGLGGVLQALLPAVEAATTAFMKMETVVSGIAGGALKSLASLLRTIMQIPFVAQIAGWGGALFLVYKANTLLFGMLGRLVGILPAQVSENAALTASFEGLTAAVEQLTAALAGVGPAAERAAIMTDAAAGQADAGLITWTRAADGAMIAETEVGTAATATATEATGAFAAMRASVAGLLGPLALAAAAVYALDKAIKALTGFDALSKAWGSAGWFADNAGADVYKAKNPYPTGTDHYTEWQAGYLGWKAGHPVPASMGGGKLSKQEVQGSIYAAGAAARRKAQRTHHAQHIGPGSHMPHVPHIPGPTPLPKVTGSLNPPGYGGGYALGLLPPAIQNALSNAQVQASLSGATTAQTGQGLNPRQVAALDQLLAAEKQALAYLDKQHATGQKLVALDQQRAQIAQQIAQTQQQLAQGRGNTGYITAQGDFQVPLAMQLAQARAAALAALIPGQQGLTSQQLALAEKVKAAALKAIRSHKLSMQGMINAWNQIAQINQQIAQSTPIRSNYQNVTPESLVKGLGLTGAQAKIMEQRIAQAQAHNFKIPGGPAALGIPITGKTTNVAKTGPGLATAATAFARPHIGKVEIHIHESHNPRETARRVLEEIRKLGGTAAVQTRGRHGGHRILSP